MPIIGSPISRGGFPRFNESSPQRSMRDKDATGKQWLKDQQTTQQVAQIQNALSATNRAVQKLRKKAPTPIMPQGSAQVKQFVMVSDGGDYYNCYTWNGTTAGSSIIKVAKHQDIRCILPSETPAGGAWATKIIRGVTYNFTYTPIAGTTDDGVNVVEYSRSVVGSNSTTETDKITPCLNVGDIISGVSTSFNAPDTLLDVVWLALADGRAWAKT